MGVRCHGFELVEGLFGSWLAVAAVMGCFDFLSRVAGEQQILGNHPRGQANCLFWLVGARTMEVCQ
ncbi:hypothetical protein BDW68DRAFT_82854 [Aspergillus falconensis]